MPPGKASPVDRLCEALADDIQMGVLTPGDRLPAHRDLAFRLNIAVGTVTKSYAQLERRGLLRSVRGRGVFVAYSPSQGGTFIDLSHNAPPAAIGERLFAKTLNGVARRLDARLFGTYPPPLGHDEHRQMMAQWFRSLGVPAEPERLILTGGAHAAVSLALVTGCGTGGTVFTEEFTYPGVLALCRQLGIEVVGVAMDREGMRPDALEQALKLRRPGRAMVYVTPNLQNPTTATMGQQRRQAITRVCRSHDLLVIEDDVYALAHEKHGPALVQLAPERTFYANSFSKTLNPALRLGGLIVPKGLFSRAAELARAHMVMVSPILCAVAQQWVMDGVADTLVSAIREESRRRRRLATGALGGIPHDAGEDGYHLWIPMDRRMAHGVEQSCHATGVLVTPAEAPLAIPEASSAGIRLCIGGASLPDLRTGLDQVARILHSTISRRGSEAPLL